MSFRERLSAVEQYVAYVIGLGIALAIIAMLLTGFGNVSSTSTTGMLLVGLALIVIGIAAWLYLARPWTKFDDLTTPYYTGHEEHAEDEAATHGVGVPAPPAEPETAAEARLGETVPAAPGEIMEAPAAEAAEEVPAPPAEPETAPAAALEEAVPTATAEPAARAAPAPVADSGARDKLVIIDGLGPKSQQVLYAAGITTFEAIANSTPNALNDILQAAGLRLVNADTWPEQAARILAGETPRSET